MRIVLIGGTGFVGRHIAHAALGAGHDVVFANRGQSDPAVFSSYEHVKIDRYDDVLALERVGAEIAIDTSGYTPDAVLATARALEKAVRSYVFVSSIDAYAFDGGIIDESSPTKTLPDGAQTAKPDAELYGAHKARCERVLVDVLGERRALAIRAGFMIGPYDTTGRFTYWPVRIAAGGEVLAPPRTMPIQLIDARDVAEWIVHAISRSEHGTFNLVGRPDQLTFGDVADTCIAVARSDATLTHVSDDFLVQHDVGPWMEMPLWVPDDIGMRGFLRASNGRACAHGLRIRPLAQSVRDVLNEFSERADKTLPTGPNRERERNLLEAWRADSK
jgi:2'-hydroxyisoflavone reductase